MIENHELFEFSGPGPDLETAIVQSLSGLPAAPFKTPTEKAPSPRRKLDTVDPALLSDISIILPDVFNTDTIKIHSYPDFGLYIWRTSRLFFSVRCGSIGQNGRGGHAHNDQLAIELQIDGEDWIADPGSFIYTADPVARDAYRSAFAHAVPRLSDDEPSNLGLGIFRLENNANAKVQYFNATGFKGIHTAYGPAIFREIIIEDGKITVRDGFVGRDTQPPPSLRTSASSGAELREKFGLTLPFSPGYGRRNLD